MAVHEAEVHVARDATRTLFVRVQFDVVTGEAERVSVDHVAKLAPTGAEGEPGRACAARHVTGPGPPCRVTTPPPRVAAPVNPHLQGLHGAVHLLSQRLLVLRNYVQAVRDGASLSSRRGERPQAPLAAASMMHVALAPGSAPHDHALLRRIQCVCNNLPTQDGASFHTELAADLNDSMLVSGAPFGRRPARSPHLTAVPRLAGCARRSRC